MKHTQTQWADLFLFVSLFFGALLRFAPTVISGSVINDGGMFYAMIEDLKANSFLLPSVTSYNHLQIPFAYPPLSLYVGGVLSWLGIPTIEIFRWIPPVVSSLSILAFYWMASHILNSKPKAALAAVAYALMPRSFSWYVMGGGLSRSFGVLFLLLACGSAWSLFSDRRSLKYALLTALFGAAAVLSHPETGLHTAASCALIWFFKGRNKLGVRDALLVAFGVIALTSPWRGTVLAQHGLGPFQSALNTGGHSGLFWIPWLTLDFAEERFVTLLTVLGLAGLAVQCIRRDWFLPIWLLLPFAIEPRSATAIAALPLAILAAQGLADIAIPKIASPASNSSTEARDWTVDISGSRAVRIVIGYVVLSAFFGAFAYDLNLANYVIPKSSRAAMQWIRENTASEARFIILSGRSDPFSDPTAEWFPVFSARTSENTIQGREWILGAQFMPFLNSLNVLQSCLNQSPDCVENWAGTHKLDFDYIYIEKPQDTNATQPSRLLADQLGHDTRYSLVFENIGVVIFGRK
jgi:hypothetical protein